MLQARDTTGPGASFENLFFTPERCSVQHLTEEAKVEYRNWAAILRATTARQTTGQLRFHDKYCCLGILAKVYRRLRDDGTCGGSSKSVQDAGLRRLFQFGESDHELRFMTYNDSWRLTFSQIADCIEWGCEYGWLP